MPLVATMVYEAAPADRGEYTAMLYWHGEELPAQRLPGSVICWLRQPLPMWLLQCDGLATLSMSRVAARRLC